MGKRPGRVTKVERFDKLTQQVETSGMALRLNQMMVQALNKQLGEVRQSLANATSMLNDFQYRMLAMQQVAGIEPTTLQALTDTLKLADFDKELIRKDTEEQAAIVTTVESDEDIVVITSTTPDAPGDHGILRSRIKIADMNLPDLAAALQGKIVGDKVEASLNGTKHIIEILGVRRLPKIEQNEEKAS